MRTENSEKNLDTTHNSTTVDSPTTAPERNPTTLPELLWLLFTTKQGWSGLAGVTAILATAMSIAIHIMRPEEIEISTNSGTITLKRGSTQNALFLLSPNGGDEETPWVETGIKVKQGDKIKITASGRVNTAIKRVVAETLNPEVDEPTWASPKGLYPSDRTIYFSALEKFKLLPPKNSAYYGFGMLLTSIRDSKEQIRTENIEPFRPSGENDDFIEFTAKNDGELVLTVNDIWLSEDMKNVYVPSLNKESFKNYLQLAEFAATFKDEDFKSWSTETKQQKVEEQYQRKLKGWDSIIENNNWNIWYADNIGSFSVSITVNPKTK